MARSRTVGRCAAWTAAAFALASATAGPLTPGNLVLYRVGPSPAGLSNTGAAVFVDEYTPGGTLVQSIAMPTTGAMKLVASGTATSEGLLTVSPDGRYVVITGYDSLIPAAAALPGSTSAAVNRTVAVIDGVTGAPVYTLLNDFASGSNPRSAVTSNGVDLWVSGGAGGVRYTTVGSTTSVNLTALGNLRQVNIADGQLVATSNSGSGGNTVSIGTIGTGLPMAGAQAFATLAGLNGVAGTNRYAFYAADLSMVVPGLDTLYIADEGAAALTKYSLVGGVFVSNGTVGVDADDYRGLAGTIKPNGTVQLFAVRRGGSTAAGGGELVSLGDASGYNGAFAGVPALLATAAANTAFRGVGFMPMGACCAAGGVCTVVFGESQCGGTFQGLGSVCDPNPCPLVVQGACCINGVCQIRTPEQCSNQGGNYLGDNIPCGGINCNGGACCLPNGNCAGPGLPMQCSNLGGTFQGFGTACVPNPCPVVAQGACCDGGICFVGTASQCDANGGHYLGDNIPCAGLNCDEGACCLPIGNCVITTVPALCVQNGGTFEGFGTVCNPSPCAPPPVGACCAVDGACASVQQGACNGTFLGVGSVCGPDTCKGACCLNDGSCSLTPANACGGTFQGIGSDCVPNNPCPQPSACCSAVNIGVCVLRPGACLANEVAVGAVCNPNPCPQQGACCLSDGTCQSRIQAVCSQIGGEWRGANTECVPNPCEAEGACCCGSTCTLTTMANCTGANVLFVGNGTVCNAPGNAVTPCCFADYNHAGGVSVQDIFDFLAAYFSGDGCTDINGSGPPPSVQDIFDFLAAYFAGCA